MKKDLNKKWANISSRALLIIDPLIPQNETDGF